MRKYTQQQFNAKGFDITIDQFVILKMLTDDTALSQSEIAKATVKDNASVTRIIDQLVKKGLVVKTPGKDKRTSDFKTTEKGEMYMQKIFPLIIDVREKGIEDVSSEELENALNTLKKISESFSF